MQPRLADIPDSTPIILYQDLEVVFCMCKQQLFHQPVSLNVAIVAVMTHFWLVLLEWVKRILLLLFSYLDVVLCDLYLCCVDVVDQFSQSLSVHLSDLHLMSRALAHIT